MAKNKQAIGDTGLDMAEQALLQDVVRTLHIPPCDLLLIGDGSGNMWDAACGWAGVLIETSTNRRRACWGAMNFGSIEFAELMPYLQAIAWYDRMFGRKRFTSHRARVQIITDSDILAQHCQALSVPFAAVSDTLAIPLTMLRSFATCGYDITVRWYRRTSLSLNTWSDVVAGLSRSQIIASGNWQDPEFVTTAAQRAAMALAHIQVTCNGAPTDIYRLSPGGVTWGAPGFQEGSTT